MSWFELGRATVCVMLVYSWVLSVILYFAADGMPYTFNLAGMKTPPPRLLAWAALGLVVQIGLCWAFYRTNHWLPELGILLNLYLIRVIHKNTWDSDVVVELGRYGPFAVSRRVTFAPPMRASATARSRYARSSAVISSANISFKPSPNRCGALRWSGRVTTAPQKPAEPRGRP